jgi:cell division septal protein FtsQ
VSPWRPSSSKRGRPFGARRDRAERYLLVTIVAFALTVAGVRWYLDMAGYPTKPADAGRDPGPASIGSCRSLSGSR